MGFVNPATLSDSELLEDLDAAEQICKNIMSSDKVPDSLKSDIKQYASDLIEEQNNRANGS